MKKRFHRLALFIGAASLAGAGLIMACSSDSAPVATPGVDGAKPDTGPTPEAGNPDTSPPVEAGADADCTKDPKLRDFANGFRCAFATGGIDGGGTCPNTDTCCNTSDKLADGGFEPSYCATGAKGDGTATCKAAAAAAGSTFDAGYAWECSDKSACAAGQVCCVISDPARAPKTVSVGATKPTDKNHPPACGVLILADQGGSRCKASCTGTEIKLCSLSDPNCGAGTTCTPITDFQGTNRGYCK